MTIVIASKYTWGTRGPDTGEWVFGGHSPHLSTRANIHTIAHAVRCPRFCSGTHIPHSLILTHSHTHNKRDELGIVGPAAHFGMCVCVCMCPWMQVICARNAFVWRIWPYVCSYGRARTRECHLRHKDHIAVSMLSSSQQHRLRFFFVCPRHPQCAHMSINRVFVWSAEIYVCWEVGAESWNDAGRQGSAT